MNPQRLKALIEAIAHEKQLPYEDVCEAVEKSMQCAMENEIPSSKFYVSLDRDSCAMQVKKKLQVVDVVCNPEMEISTQDSDLVVGSTFYQDYEDLYFHRISISHAKQILLQAINLAVAKTQSNHYPEGSLLRGQVSQLHPDKLIISIDNESIQPVIFRNHLLSADRYRYKDDILAVVHQVKIQGAKCLVKLSRTSKEFIQALFTAYIPEIKSGKVEIKGIARDQHSTKVAIFSKFNNIDAVGSCIGIKGMRINSLIQIMNGEKLDVVLYDQDPVRYAIQALNISPVHVKEVHLNPHLGNIDLVVDYDKVPQVIGSGGINIRQASELVGMRLFVRGFASTVKYWQGCLGCSLDIAQMILDLNIQDILSLSQQENLPASLEIYRQKAIELSLKQQLIQYPCLDIDGLTVEQSIKLSNQGITDAKQLAEMDLYDLIEICSTLSEQEAADIILSARRGK